MSAGGVLSPYAGPGVKPHPSNTFHTLTLHANLILREAILITIYVLEREINIHITRGNYNYLSPV